MTSHACPGDDTGIELPIGPEELAHGGRTFLTAALRAYGTLTPHNSVTAVTELREVSGGSTGRKALLSVSYERPGAPSELFVKFSRDTTDPRRDRGREQMRPEIRLAALSRQPGFPITVPRTVFADYHRNTGTGILITERIPFGQNGIAPQHHKCLDYEIPNAFEHYGSVVDALARLAGWQRAGHVPPDQLDAFPVDLQAATVGDAPALHRDRSARQATRLVEFVESHPGLFPEFAPGFLATLPTELPKVVDHEPAVWRYLATASDHLALCHWNANLDNAWFWRDEGGTLRCGLLDWGCVSRMNVAMALWGALSAAEISLWDRHFDELTTRFAAQYAASGGPELDTDELARQVLAYAGTMGVTWLLDTPALISARLGDTARQLTRFDAPVRDDESLRAPLQMLTNVLNLWQTRDIGALLASLGQTAR